MDLPVALAVTAAVLGVAAIAGILLTLARGRATTPADDRRFEAGSLILMVGDGIAPPADLLAQLAEEPEPAIAIVPDDECSWPTVTSVSVIASLVVLTAAVGWA